MHTGACGCQRCTGQQDCEYTACGLATSDVTLRPAELCLCVQVEIGTPRGPGGGVFLIGAEGFDPQVLHSSHAVCGKDSWVAWMSGRTALCCHLMALTATRSGVMPLRLVL